MRLVLLPLLLASICLPFADPAAAQTCTPFDQGCIIAPTAAGEDVSPYCFLPTLARGDYETNYALTANDDDGGCHDFETYLRFVLPSNLLAPGQTVTEATLLLYYGFSFVLDGTPTAPPHAPITLRIHEVTSAWTEASTTWANRPGHGAPIATLGGITNYGIRSFDVTELVRHWAHGTKPNRGFAVTSPDARAIGFHSWEAEPTVPATQKARLYIEVGTGSPPPSIPLFPY
jgi:hypothetical protein